MVQLTVTPAAKAAVEEFVRGNESHSNNTIPPPNNQLSERIAQLAVGDPIDHDDLIKISQHLVSRQKNSGRHDGDQRWRLDTLLRGAQIFEPPRPQKPEPTPEYKALMKRLREQEERRQYENMLNPPTQPEKFGTTKFSIAGNFPDPRLSIGKAHFDEEVDEVTYADVNRQMALIINVLVSIIACSIAIWIAARRWDVPQRLGLSMSGSVIVAVAEVAIYMGYIRRIKEAKAKEVSKVETKEIVETWVLDAKEKVSVGEGDGVRYRKGRHR